MSLFPLIDAELEVQVGDKTRINVIRSFVTADEDAISKLEVKPSASDDYVDVTEEGYLDWCFDTAGDVTITCRITSGVTTATATKAITVLSEDDDNLFAEDADLQEHEPEIMNMLAEGKASFKNMHRRAQKQIIAWLDREGYVDSDGDKLTKAALVDHSEVSQWSIFQALQLIFEGSSNAKDDIFAKKSEQYDGKVTFWRGRAILRLDLDGDEEIDEQEGVDVRTCIVVRR